MRFVSPEWFLLIPAFAAVAWFVPASGLRRPLRAVCALLLVLVLARPEWRRAADGLDLWLLVDRSDSVSGKTGVNVAECERILEKSRGWHDRMHLVDFAEDPLLRSEGDGTSVYPAGTKSTKLAAAVRYALARSDPTRPTRLLALTDGFSTDSTDGLSERLVREQVALDLRLVGSERAGNYSIRSFAAPSRVRAGEAFILSVAVRGPAGREGRLTLARDGEVVGESPVLLGEGESRLRFTDRVTRGGSHRYEVRVTGEGDAFPGDNVAATRVEIASGPRTLLVTAYADDPLAGVLRAQGSEVEVIDNPERADVGRLTGARLVILNNVPAYKLPGAFLSGLEFFVGSQGGGLLMAGGKTSFASGGYFGSAIDPVLPVSMELKQEHRKLALNMVVILDRSGSMSCGVPGTSLQKMDLADAGAARTIELLGDNDAAALFAVDTEAHEVSPLLPVRSARGRLIADARRIKSAGGGICVPTGLRAAHKVLRDAPPGRRHVIVFADANDATQEAPDPAQIAAMRKDGITVSCIGMGRATDSGGRYLEEVAKQGGGRVFFNENPGDLPAMFSQETAAVARSAFLDKPVGLTASSGWSEIAARAPGWPAAVDGYNLCYLRPGSTGALYSSDEYKAPLVAFRRHGAGRSAAVTFPLAGEHSGRVREWPGYADFLRTLTRWLEGEPQPAGAALRTALDGATFSVEFLHDDSWTERLAMKPPVLRVAFGADGKAEDVPWEKMAPGRYRALLHLEAGRPVRGAVLAGDSVLPFGPVETSVNPEWDASPSRLEAVRAVSAASGGVERADLTSVWNAPRRASWQDLSAPLLSLFAIFFLADAFVSHTGWRRKAVAKETGAA